MFIGKAFRNGIGEILGRDNKFGVAAIHGVTGEHRVVAEILHASAAIFAGSVRPMQPGDANARSGRESLCTVASFLNDADHLVPGDHRRFARGQFSFDYVQIGPAHAAGAHSHEHFPALRLWRRNFREFQRIRSNRSRGAQHACFHRGTSALSLPIRFALV